MSARDQSEKDTPTGLRSLCGHRPQRLSPLYSDTDETPPQTGSASAKSGHHASGHREVSNYDHVEAEPPSDGRRAARPEPWDLITGPRRKAQHRLRISSLWLQTTALLNDCYTNGPWRGHAQGCPAPLPGNRPLRHLELLLLGHRHRHVSHEEGVPLLLDLIPVVLHVEPAQVVLFLCARAGGREQRWARSTGPGAGGESGPYFG